MVRRSETVRPAVLLLTTLMGWSVMEKVQPGVPFLIPDPAATVIETPVADPVQGVLPPAWRASTSPTGPAPSQLRATAARKLATGTTNRESSARITFSLPGSRISKLG